MAAHKHLQVYAEFQMSFGFVKAMSLPAHQWSAGTFPAHFRQLGATKLA